jgi:hypothetical protein
MSAAAGERRLAPGAPRLVFTDEQLTLLALVSPP